MKNLYGILLFSFFLFSSSCLHKKNNSLEEVLKLAGSNRHELERVIKHYSTSPDDSLKLKAAEFLILNMPGKYSEYYDLPWNDAATVFLRWTSSSNKQLVAETYRLGEPVKREDVKYITADYLISNIDLAFQSWQDKPWGKDIPFDVFCEEILPYRVETEPLENWREKALASFADFNKTFQDTVISSVEACRQVNAVLPNFQLDWDFPTMSYTQIMASRRGSCESQAALAIFVMRALGIPVTFEYTPKWFRENRGHSWNAVRDSTGKYISFMGAETAPGAWHTGVGSNTTKIYRLTFSGQNVFRNVSDTISWEKHPNHTRDVSSEYDGYETVEVLDGIPHSPSENIYLAAWGERTWNIVGLCDSLVSLQKNVLYLPVYYTGGRQVPVKHPFIVHEKDSIQFFKPDTVNKQTVEFDALSPITPGWRFRMQNGYFEGANKPDFSDAERLYKITDVPDDKFHEVKIKTSRPFRYFRYVSPTDKAAHCNVAEIKLLDSSDSIISGTPIGTSEVWDAHPTMTHDKAFDGDVRTFFDAKDNNSWTGLDLDFPRTISKIHYLPRTVDYFGIYAEHIYELFYWSDQGWKSLGEQQGTLEPLRYQVPKNALFYLKNKTIDKEGVRIFSILDGIQKWI